MRACFLFSFWVFCHGGQLLFAENLISNPSFEKADGGSPAEWIADARGWRNGAHSKIDSADHHTGQNSLLLNQSKPLELPPGVEEAPNLVKFIQGNKAGGYVTVSKIVPVEAGKSYNLSYWYKSAELVRENRDDPKRGYASFQVFLDWQKEKGIAVDGKENLTWVTNEQLGSPEWTQVENRLAHKSLVRPYLAPPGARFVQLRFILTTVAPDVAPKVWIDDVSFADADAPKSGSGEEISIPLANAGFEEGVDSFPSGWKAQGSAKSEWAAAPVHSGKKAVAVSDAGLGALSGWAQEVPVQKNFVYSLRGWAKGGDLKSNGPVGGGAFCMQFLDRDGQTLGSPVISETVSSNTDWKELKAEPTRPPNGAVALRVTAGLQFCNGSAWFDDVGLTAFKEDAAEVVVLRRENPQPSPGVVYAENLLTNGDVEAGDGANPKGWVYIGKADKDWTQPDIAAFHREGRPRFDVGRGRGEWSRNLTYAGGGALLNISIDPPLSKNMQWYGRNPVSGYWLSSPIPCVAGKSYLASAWIRPGVNIEQAWHGPLEIEFFDAGGRKIPTAIRPGLNDAPAATWTYWATLPYQAPATARTMRLRFGQELSGAEGGWGKTYADNLALWQLSEEVTAEKTQDFALRSDQFWKWFRTAHDKVKPPYLPAPVEAPAYPNAKGRGRNSVPGNIFPDPKADTVIEVAVTNQLGEARELSLHMNRYDWLGNAHGEFDVPAFTVAGYSDGKTTVKLPATGKYGSFYLDCKIKEGEAVVGEFSVRYAVVPKLDRPRTTENIWGVTTLSPFFGDQRPHEEEMGQLMKMAGFGLSWVSFSDKDQNFEALKREVEWYLALGIRPILRIYHFEITRPIDRAHFFDMGKSIASTFKGKVAAYGNWGVEQANHRTPDKPVFRPIIGGKMLTDEEYDLILAAIHDGIKSVDTKTPVLIGNIATDWNGETIKRLYGKPADGRFDGAILNAYMGVVNTAVANLKQFDAHGDTGKTVWQEENADQASPISGNIRRYGEAEGGKNLVRVWVTMKATCGPRLKAMTLWGFALDTPIAMVTPDLQPRPQFVAHAIMADALADATFKANHSGNNLSCFEWGRSGTPLFTVWTGGGSRDLRFEVTGDSVTVTDVMGNRADLSPVKGIVTVQATNSPVYVSSAGPMRLVK